MVAHELCVQGDRAEHHAAAAGRVDADRSPGIDQYQPTAVVAEFEPEIKVPLNDRSGPRGRPVPASQTWTVRCTRGQDASPIRSEPGFAHRTGGGPGTGPGSSPLRRWGGVPPPHHPGALSTEPSGLRQCRARNRRSAQAAGVIVWDRLERLETDVPDGGTVPLRLTDKSRLPSGVNASPVRPAA